MITQCVFEVVLVFWYKHLTYWVAPPYGGGYVVLTLKPLDKPWPFWQHLPACGHLRYFVVLDPANSEPDASTHQHCLVSDLHWTSSNFPSGLHSGPGIIEPWERSCWAWQAVDCIPVMAIYCLSYQALWSGIHSLVIMKCFGSGLQTSSKLEFLYVTLYHLTKQGYTNYLDVQFRIVDVCPI